jgi:Zn-dependent protease
MGALVGMKDVPTNAAQEARVGIAGPILGTVGVLGVFGLAKLFGDPPILLALTFTGAFLNLFNLLPVSPLDGGRVAAALSPKLWIAGIVAMVGLTIMWPNPILILILLFGAMDSWRRYKGREDNPRYYEVAPAERATLAVSFIALAGLLVLIMEASYVPRSL